MSASQTANGMQNWSEPDLSLQTALGVTEPSPPFKAPLELHVCLANLIVLLGSRLKCAECGVSAVVSWCAALEECR